MARSARTRRALRNGFNSAAAETVAHDLAKKFSKMLGKYVEPHSFCFNEARGYWAHNHQDVQRIAGHFRAVGDNMTYSIGSWDNTLSTLARSGCHIIDTRGDRLADNDFLLEKGREPMAADEYSSVQIEEIARKEGLQP